MGVRGIGFAPGQMVRETLPVFAGGMTNVATGALAAGGQGFNPAAYQLSGANMSVRFVAVAVRNTTGTGFVVLRSVTDGNAGVYTLPVGVGTLQKLSSPIIPFLSADKVYDLVMDKGSSLGLGLAYAGFEIDRTF